MKNLLYATVILGSLILISCQKDELSERVKLLTGPTLLSNSLLANGTGFIHLELL